jgi:hypothetical protein
VLFRSSSGKMALLATCPLRLTFAFNLVISRDDMWNGTFQFLNQDVFGGSENRHYTALYYEIQKNKKEAWQFWVQFQE